MGKQIKLEELHFDEEYNTERVFLTASYRNLLFAKLSFARPCAYDLPYLFIFMGTPEYTYIKSKLLKVIQMDLDRLNAESLTDEA